MALGPQRPPVPAQLLTTPICAGPCPAPCPPAGPPRWAETTPPRLLLQLHTPLGGPGQSRVELVPAAPAPGTPASRWGCTAGSEGANPPLCPGRELTAAQTRGGGGCVGPRDGSWGHVGCPQVWQRTEKSRCLVTSRSVQQPGHRWQSGGWGLRGRGGTQSLGEAHCGRCACPRFLQGPEAGSGR